MSWSRSHYLTLTTTQQLTPATLILLHWEKSPTLVGNCVNEVIDYMKACCHNKHTGNSGLRTVTSRELFYSSFTAPQPLTDRAHFNLGPVLCLSIMWHTALQPALASFPSLILFPLLLPSPCTSMSFKNRLFFYSSTICPSRSKEAESTTYVPKPPPSTSCDRSHAVHFATA